MNNEAKRVIGDLALIFESKVKDGIRQLCENDAFELSVDYQCYSCLNEELCRLGLSVYSMQYEPHCISVVFELDNKFTLELSNSILTHFKIEIKNYGNFEIDFNDDVFEEYWCGTFDTQYNRGLLKNCSDADLINNCIEVEKMMVFRVLQSQ